MTRRARRVGMAALLTINPFSLAGMALDQGGASPPARGPELQVPALKILEVGIEFNADMARHFMKRRHRPDAKPLTLLSAGPGCPGLAPAPKDRVVKYPAHWTVVETPREVGGANVSPETLLVKLPEVLVNVKPEVVLLWGDVEGKRTMKVTERHDWEDVVTVCLRLGVLPIMVMPNGRVSFTGGGEVGWMVKMATRKAHEAKAQEQDALDDLETFRRTMTMVGGTQRVPQVEQAPFSTLPNRLARLLYLVEKHVLDRNPPEFQSPEKTAGAGAGTKPGKSDEVE